MDPTAQMEDKLPVWYGTRKIPLQNLMKMTECRDNGGAESMWTRDINSGFPLENISLLGTGTGIGTACFCRAGAGISVADTS